MAQTSAEQYAALRAAGLCVSCRKPAKLKGGKRLSRCAACSTGVVRTNVDAWRDGQIEKGLCIECTEPAAVRDGVTLTRCEKHRAATARRVKASRKRKA